MPNKVDLVKTLRAISVQFLNVTNVIAIGHSVTNSESTEHGNKMPPQ